MIPAPPPKPPQTWEQQLALAKLWTAGLKKLAKNNKPASKEK